MQRVWLLSYTLVIKDVFWCCFGRYVDVTNSTMCDNNTCVMIDRTLRSGQVSSLLL